MDESVVTDARKLTGRWLFPILYPVRERHPECPHRVDLGIGIQLLLAFTEPGGKRCGAVLRADHDVGTKEVRLAQITLSQRIGQPERLPTLPNLKRGGDMENLGTGVRAQASIKNDRGLPG